MRIPLPDEMPPTPDLKHLPLSVLHKGTVDYLLNQNQDLMSRLSVNIRRITELEEKLQDKQEQLQVSSDQAHYVTGEMQIAKEGQRRLESQLSETRSELVVLEKRMAEHFGSSSSLRDALESENRQLREDLFHLQNYRRRINQQVRPMVDRLKSENEDMDARIFRMEVEKQDLDRRVNLHRRYRERIRKFVRPLVSHLKQGWRYWEARSLEQDQLQAAVKTQLTEAYMQIQKQTQEQRSEQNTLVEHYERRASELRTTIEKSERDLEYYKKVTTELTAQVDNFSGSQTRAENKSVEIERRLQIFETEVRKERELNFQEKQLMNEEIQRVSEDIRGKSSELVSARRALLHSEERLQVFEMENRELRAQLNALQSLWENNMQQLKHLHAREISLAGKVVSGQSVKDVIMAPELSPTVVAGRESISRIEKFLNELQAGTFSNAGPNPVDPNATVEFGTPSSASKKSETEAKSNPKANANPS